MSDNAIGVRSEDAFDTAALARWLGALDPVLAAEPSVRQFAGGASNLTYLLSYADRELVLRRPPAGAHVGTAHDMRREHDLQRAVGTISPLVPRMIACCDDPAVLGSPFYVMERVPGIILRRDIPAGIGLDDPERVGRLCRTAVDVLVGLHELDVDAAGLRHLDRGPGYVHRQVAGWTERYRRARTPDAPDFEASMAWLAAHEPSERPHVLIHNDFRFDNLVLDTANPTRVVGVLDWELATVGDPLMDLGSALAYWVQPGDDPRALAVRLQPTHTPGMLTRDEVVTAYCAARGIEVSAQERLFLEVFGAFRLAGIAQQIYARYAAGQTTNPAHGRIKAIVGVLHDRCAELLS